MNVKPPPLSIVPEAPQPERDEPPSLARYRAQRAEAKLGQSRGALVRDAEILDALLMTGAALADHGHRWTEAEREAFDYAVALLEGEA